MQFIKKLVSSNFKKKVKFFLLKHSLWNSQAGQDVWVVEEVFNKKKGGYFLDIGANDGIDISNTWKLESKYNWKGICVEANPIVFEDLIKNRSVTCLNICLDRGEGEVDFALRGVIGGIIDVELDNKNSDGCEVRKLRTKSLNSVLYEEKAPNIIDYLSVDVEGAEERIFLEFNFDRYTFKCITIERPSNLLRELLEKHGYILIKEIPGLDCFYIHNSFLKQYRDNLFFCYQKKGFRLEISLKNGLKFN